MKKGVYFSYTYTSARPAASGEHRRLDQSMKRIMYISTATLRLSGDEIGRISSRNNLKVGITGILFSAHEFFFQILEG
jgi:hypothetical protein